MDSVSEGKLREVSPYLSFLRRLDEDTSLDTILFHVLYQFSDGDFARLLDSLSDANVTAGFPVPAVHLEDEEVVGSLRRVLDGGHELLLHGCRHTSYRDASYEVAAKEITTAFDSFEKKLGVTPGGFHVPFMSASEGTLRAADDQGIEWVVGKPTAATPSNLPMAEPTFPYDLHLLERGLTPKGTFERLDAASDELSLLLCHPNIHVYHGSSRDFTRFLRESAYSSPADLVAGETMRPGLLLDRFPPFRIL